MCGLRSPPGDSDAHCCWSLRTRDYCAHAGAVVWAGKAGLSFFGRLVFECSPGQFQIPEQFCAHHPLSRSPPGPLGQKMKHLSNTSQSSVPVTSECFMCNILFNPFLQLVSHVLQDRILSLTKILAPKGQITGSGCFRSLCSLYRTPTASLTLASSARRSPWVPPTQSACQPGRAPLGRPPYPTQPAPCLMLISHLSTEHFINSKSKMNFLPAIISSLDIH